jgi:3-oxoadipate enol-lactonase
MPRTPCLRARSWTVQKWPTAWSHSRARSTDPGALAAQAAAGAGYTGRLRQTRIRARTLVLHGSADTVVDPGNGKLLADRIPGAQLVIFPELGHLLVWEDPDGFVDAVTSFLLADRVPRNVLHAGRRKH